MTSFVKFAPQVADHFNITQQHFFDVFMAAQQVEARTWFYCVIIWVALTLISSLLLTTILWLSNNRQDSYGTLLLIIAIILGMIFILVLIIAGNVYNGMINYEYEVFLDYIRGLGVYSS